MLGSAFTPPLQQCEAAARAACCSHRSPQNKDTESPSTGFRILQLCSSTHSYSHQHAHSHCPSSPLGFYICIYVCLCAFASHSFSLSGGLITSHKLVPMLFGFQFSRSASLYLIRACDYIPGGIGNKTSSSIKPQATSRSPCDDITSPADRMGVVSWSCRDPADVTEIRHVSQAMCRCLNGRESKKSRKLQKTEQEDAQRRMQKVMLPLQVNTAVIQANYIVTLEHISRLSKS